MSLNALSVIYLHLDNEEQAEAAFVTFREKYGAQAPVPIAENFAQRGDFDAAFAWFDRAYEQRSPNLVTTIVHPMNDPLKADPRFNQLLQKLQLMQATASN